MGKNSFFAGLQNARILRYNYANNILPKYPNLNQSNNNSNINVDINNRVLLLIDEIFYTRFNILFKYLIDYGYILQNIDTEIVTSSTDINSLITNKYNSGYRVFVGNNNTEKFINLQSFFTEKTDAVYINTGSTLYTKYLIQSIPNNMITTSSNVLDICNFIVDKIVINFDKYIKLLDDINLNKYFAYFDSTTSNQVFDHIIYITDDINLTGQNYIDNFIEVINNNNTYDITLSSFLINLNSNNPKLDNELITLLTENPINNNNFKYSTNKCIFVINCTNYNNCQKMLDLFNNESYYNNIIIFNEIYLTRPLNVSFNSNYYFSNGFIISGGFSEFIYKLSGQIFKDYNVGGETMSLLDVLMMIPNLYNKVKSNGGNVSNLINYLIESNTINGNSWFIKSRYLYKINDTYNNKLQKYDIDSSLSIFQKSFNPDTSGTSSSNDWIDDFISTFASTDTNINPDGVYSNSLNLKYYNDNGLNNDINPNLNYKYIAFTSIDDIALFKTKLNTYFNKDPAIASKTNYGIWKVLNNPYITTLNVELPEVVNMYIPTNVLNDTENSAYDYYYIPFSYYLKYSYNNFIDGTKQVNTTDDTLNIAIPLKYSSDIYLLYFNKGNSYYNSLTGKTNRGPLLVHIQTNSTNINNFYRIGDILTIKNTDEGTNIQAEVKSISNNCYNLNVAYSFDKLFNGINSSNKNTGISLLISSNTDISKMFIGNTDINKNIWSNNGCYYLTLLSNGNLIAVDYRTNYIFWSTNSFSPNCDSLQLDINGLNLINNNGSIYYTIINGFSNISYPISLLITDDRNIVILNGNNNILWSSNTNVKTNLTNNSIISNTNKLYSSNGYYNLSFLNGNLSLINENINYNNGLIWQTYNMYFYDDLSFLSQNNTIANQGISTNLKSITDITYNTVTGSSSYYEGAYNKFTMVLSGFFKPIVSGVHRFTISSAGSSYLWLGDNAKPENRQISNATINNKFTLNITDKYIDLSLIENIYYPFCIIYGENTDKNQFKCSITLPNKNVITNGIGYLYTPQNIDINSNYFWSSPLPIYNTNTYGLTWTSYKGFYNNNLSFFISNNSLKYIGLNNAYSGYTYNMTSLGLATSLNISTYNPSDRQFSIMWTGYIMFPQTDTYTLSINIMQNTSILSQIWIDTKAVSGYTIQNADINSQKNLSYSQSFISNKYYPIRIIYGQQSGNNQFILTIKNSSGTTITQSSSNIIFYQDNLNTNCKFIDNTFGLYNDFGMYKNIINDGILSNNIPKSPYTLKIENNRDLCIYNADDTLYWNLNTPILKSIIQDNAIINKPYPRTGDEVVVYYATNPRYNNTTAIINSVDKFKNINVTFFEDDSILSNVYYDKPELLNSIDTDSDTKINLEKLYISNLETSILKSTNENFFAKLELNGTLCIYDSRQTEPFKIWCSNEIVLDNNEIVESLEIDSNGSLFINTNLKYQKSFIFDNSKNHEDDEPPFTLTMTDDGNLVITSSDIDSTTKSNKVLWVSNNGILNRIYTNDIITIKKNILNFSTENGVYRLLLNNGLLTVLNINDNSTIYNFKYVFNPLFYSNVNNFTITNDTNSNLVPKNTKHLIDSRNLNTYFNKCYEYVITNINSNIQNNYLQNIYWLWTTTDSLTNKNTGKGTYTFSYKYNNPRTVSIYATLVISVVESCIITQYNNNYTDKANTIGTVGGSKDLWGEIKTFNIILTPGTNTFKFQTSNSGGRCGVVYFCYEIDPVSINLTLDNNGNLCGKDINNNNNIILSNTSNNKTKNPYTLIFNNDGSLEIRDNSNSSCYKTTTDITPDNILNLNIAEFTDSNGYINSLVNLYPQNLNDVNFNNTFTQFLWSSNQQFFFGITKEKSIVIYDCRFEVPIYTLYSSNNRSTYAIYMVLDNNGVLKAYDNTGVIFWNSSNTANNTLTNYKLELDDNGILSIIGKNLSNNDITVWQVNNKHNINNTLISNTNKQFTPNSIIAVSSNANYVLKYTSNGSLKIYYVSDDTNPTKDFYILKDINTYDLTKNDKGIEKYTINLYENTSNISPGYLIFNNAGQILLYTSTNTIYWQSNAANLGIPEFKLVLSNNGNLEIYDAFRNMSLAYDNGGILDRTNWSVTYNNNGLKNNLYAKQYYKWIWNKDSSYIDANVETVNFLTTYNNTTNSNINATLAVAVDDSCDVYVNKINVGNVTYNNLKTINITLVPNINLIEFVAKNIGGPAGLFYFAYTPLATNLLFYSNNTTTSPDSAIVYELGSVLELKSKWSAPYAALGFSNNTATTTYKWIWTTSTAANRASAGKKTFIKTYTNTNNNILNIQLNVCCDDSCNIYQNNNLIGSISSYNTMLSISILLTPGENTFRFEVTNGGNNPAGLVFWCIEIPVLFYSNSNNVYTPNELTTTKEDLGFKIWESNTGYTETIQNGKYLVDINSVRLNHLVSNENTYIIPTQRIYSPNKLYYLLYETDGSLSAYITKFNQKYWSNNITFIDPTNLLDPGRLSYGPNGLCLYKSNGESYWVIYNNIKQNVVYTFFIDNDKKIKLTATDGTIFILNN